MLIEHLSDRFGTSTTDVVKVFRDNKKGSQEFKDEVDILKIVGQHVASDLDQGLIVMPEAEGRTLSKELKEAPPHVKADNTKFNNAKKTFAEVLAEPIWDLWVKKKLFRWDNNSNNVKFAISN
jgi:hypothetical protein